MHPPLPANESHSDHVGVLLCPTAYILGLMWVLNGLVWGRVGSNCHGGPHKVLSQAEGSLLMTSTPTPYVHYGCSYCGDLDGCGALS